MEPSDFGIEFNPPTNLSNAIEFMMDEETGMVSILVWSVMIDQAPAGSDELSIMARAIGKTIARIVELDCFQCQ